MNTRAELDWDAIQRLIQPAGSMLLGIAVPFEHLILPGNQAESAIAALRTHRRDVTPVILGGSDNLVSMAGLFDEPPSETNSPLRAIQLANALNLDEWLDNRKAEFAEDGREVERNEWPADIEPQAGIISTTDILTRKFHEAVGIALLPTALPFEAAAYLRMGGWNEMPDAVEQVALHKRWYEQWQARPVVMAMDTVEFEVLKPIASRDDALRVALEMYLACPDAVEQGMGSLDALAASLMDARNWFMWWD